MPYIDADDLKRYLDLCAVDNARGQMTAADGEDYRRLHALLLDALGHDSLSASARLDTLARAELERLGTVHQAALL